MTTDESGELLGTHVWDEELIKETRGEFMFAHVGRRPLCGRYTC
jgi:hypothetical protein